MESLQTNTLLNSKERFFINHSQLEALLKNIPKLIYMKDTKGNYVIGTEHAQEFVKSGSDVLHNVRLDTRKMRNTNDAEDKYVIGNNKTISNEREIYDVNGIPHWYNIYKAPISNPNGKVIGIVVMVDNIDEPKILEAQRETFVASLGHDLKNPTLAQIRALEFVLKGGFGKIDIKLREILEMVLDSCRYMGAMLSSILVTYRNDRGVVRLNYEEISLVNLVMESVGEMIYLAKDKEVGVSIDKDCEIPTIWGDKVQIKRVIMNLLSNGIKYAYKNTTLHIAVYNEGDYTCFKFENKSPFIPLDKRESIFAQYVSYAEAYKELGIGLGLYTSQKIVEAHDGQIFVESFEDDRNIFGFKIPNGASNKDKLRTVAF